jgi:hypothetical protein
MLIAVGFSCRVINKIYTSNSSQQFLVQIVAALICIQVRVQIAQSDKTHFCLCFRHLAVYAREDVTERLREVKVAHCFGQPSYLIIICGNIAAFSAFNTLVA